VSTVRTEIRFENYIWRVCSHGPQNLHRRAADSSGELQIARGPCERIEERFFNLVLGHERKVQRLRQGSDEGRLAGARHPRHKNDSAH
jgi:hypothetical protein